MQKRVIIFLFSLSTICVCFEGKAQVISEFDQLVYVNPEWKNQQDVDPQLKLNPPKILNEQQLVQLHLQETEKLLRKRNVTGLSPALQRARAKNLDILHQYLIAGIFPVNSKHSGRQPYFIDDNNVYCAVGYLMKKSGAGDVASDINQTQNFSFLVDIHHEKLMNWVRHSGLSFDELALIQPGYGYEWPAAVVEFHYNNAGADMNEYIEIHQSSGALVGMIPFDTVRFYDGVGTLYKELPILEMQTFSSGVHHFYHYQFPSNESFTDDGRIEISGRGPLGTSQLISAITYTNSSVQVQDYYNYPGSTPLRSFNMGESESSLVNSSLNFCDFYYSPGWNLTTQSNSIGTLNACLILPVTLSDFSYVVDNKKVILNWETVSETNSRQFIIERSSGGSDFKALDSFMAAGTSNVVKRYTFTDHWPGYINHYRLKQMDIDGKFVYSKILYVKVDRASPLQLMQNPVTTTLRYQLSPGMIGSKLVVYDMHGRSVYITIAKEGVQQIDVSQWSAGKYLIHVIAMNGEVCGGLFVKQ